MRLMELARKWLTLTPVTDEEREEKDQFQVEASKLYLEYHGNEPWAHKKLQAGLKLTPEAVGYMETELAARKAYNARMAEIKKQLEQENVEPTRRIPSQPVGDDVPRGADAGDATGPGN